MTCRGLESLLQFQESFLCLRTYDTFVHPLALLHTKKTLLSTICLRTLKTASDWLCLVRGLCNNQSHGAVGGTILETDRCSCIWAKITSFKSAPWIKKKLMPIYTKIPNIGADNWLTPTGIICLTMETKVPWKCCYFYTLVGRTSCNTLLMGLFADTITSSKESNKPKKAKQIIHLCHFLPSNNYDVLLSVHHIDPKQKATHLCPHGWHNRGKVAKRSLCTEKIEDTD